MTQEVVTAIDVAAPTDSGIELPDAENICDRLDEAFSRDGFQRATYSEDAKILFQQAWAVAAHKQNTQVTIYHLAFALVFHFPEVGNRLAECLGTDVDSIAIGCTLRILPLGVAPGEAAVLAPAIATVRWVGQAAAVTNDRGTGSELLPDDLVRAILDERLSTADVGALRSAARAGKARRETVLGQREAPSIADAAETSRDIISHMEDIESGQPLSGATDVSEVLAFLEDFEDRYEASVAVRAQEHARIERAIVSNRLANVAASDDDIMRKLAAIDQHMTDIRAALPKPPSAMRLAVAVIAVLSLGVGVGLALSPNGPAIAEDLARSVTFAFQKLGQL